MTFTVKVTSSQGTPTGLVNFTDSSNGSTMASVKLAKGAGKFPTFALAPGTRDIVAHYLGSGAFGASTSAGRKVTVAPAGSEAVAYQIDPSHDGRQAVGVLSTKSLHKKWSVTLGKAGGAAAEAGDVSYPVVAGGLVFVTVENVQSSGTTLYARRVSTGAKVWSVGLPGTFGFSALAYDGHGLFALNDTGLLTAFVASTGQELGSIQLPGQSDFTAPPTAYDGVVYASGAGSGGTLYAVSEFDGLGRWKASVTNGDKSAPAVDDTGVYVSYDAQQDYRFSLHGKLLWHHNTGSEGGGGSTAVLHGNDVYARGAHDSPVILSKTSGASVGSFASDTAPAFDSKNMYTLLNGQLVAVNPAGSPDRWAFGTGNLVTAPVVSGGTVFVGAGNGTVYGVSASTGKQVWSGKAGSVILAPDEQNDDVLAGLAVGNGLLVVPAGRTLTAFSG